MGITMGSPPGKVVVMSMISAGISKSYGRRRSRCPHTHCQNPGKSAASRMEGQVFYATMGTVASCVRDAGDAD